MKPLRINFVDSARAEIESDGRWDLTLPNKHLRGQADDVESARLAVNAAHDQYVLAQWERGTPIAKGRFVCPLT